MIYDLVVVVLPLSAAFLALFFMHDYIKERREPNRNVDQMVHNYDMAQWIILFAIFLALIGKA